MLRFADNLSIKTAEISVESACYLSSINLSFFANLLEIPSGQS